MNPCLHCGYDAGDENPPSPQHCGNCPPWRCDSCGEMSSNSALCSCWTNVADIPLADLKALFADDCKDDGLSLTLGDLS